MSVLLLRSGASSNLVGPILLRFGVFGLLRIWSAGSRLDRHLRGSALVILSAGIAGEGAFSALALVIVAAGAWVNASANAGIAAGAALGGVILASAGIRDVALLAAAFVILAIVTVLRGRRVFRNSPWPSDAGQDPVPAGPVGPDR